MLIVKNVPMTDASINPSQKQSEYLQPPHSSCNPGLISLSKDKGKRDGWITTVVGEIYILKIAKGE